MHQGSQEKEGLPLIPQGTTQAPTKERTSNPGSCGMQQLKQSWGSQRLGLWVPPAAHHYLHEDPKEQGSHPDLDGQLPHGAAGVAPAAAAGAVRGSQGSGPERLARAWAVREARCRPREGAGGGRGVGAAGRAQPQSHALGSRTPKQHTGRFGSHSRSRRSEALRGLPAPLSRVQFPCLGLAPRTRDPGREAWGSPRCRRRGLPERAAWLPRYWAAPGLCARLHALPAAGRCAPPLHPATPALALCSFHTHPHVGLKWMGALGILSLRSALASSGPAWEHLFLPGFCLPKPCQAQILSFPTPDSRKFPRDCSQASLSSEGAREAYKNLGTD